MPFFTGLTEAERYAKSRPFFHPLAIARAKEAAHIGELIPLALDVACGTGHSTAALLSIAERVIGIDISFNMLANARSDERIRYVQAQAESIPIHSGVVPIVTTALAFHWFHRKQFLSEVRRILSDGGLLLVYNNGFTGIMREDPAFRKWSYEVYPEWFPTPPRDSHPLTSKEASGSGFVLIEAERYENEVHFSPETLVAYLTTQTNVVVAIEQGRESIESASQWLP